MTTARKSRASRAAEQADQVPEAPPEEAATATSMDVTPEPEPAEDEDEEADQEDEEAEATPKPEARPGAYALIDTEVAPITFHRPRVQVCVTGPDGAETVESVTCEHTTWWHTTPEIALRCARRIAAQRGLTIGPAA